MDLSRITAVLYGYLGGSPIRRKPATPEQRGADLVKAIDAGGLPLNPAIVNDIARQLGLEVSSRAPMDQTIARIRQVLKA
jgi:hypothetical protein